MLLDEVVLANRNGKLGEERDCGGVEGQNLEAVNGDFSAEKKAWSDSEGMEWMMPWACWRYWRLCNLDFFLKS